MALTPQQALWLELMPFYIREAWLLDERNLEAVPLENGEVEAKTAFLMYRSSAPLRLPRGFPAARGRLGRRARNGPTRN